MSSSDYVRYLTEQIVRYIDSPKQERKRTKKKDKQPVTSRWFGLIPFALGIFVRKRFKR